MKEYRASSISLGYLFNQLYGQDSCNEIRDFQDVSLLKKYCLKLIKSYSHAIEQTIEVSDRNQINNLKKILSHGEEQIKRCKTFSELDQIFIFTQSRLIFQLLGEIPNRWQSKKVQNRKENWKLNSYRQIQYVQTINHKGRLAFNLIKDKYLDKFGSWTNFMLDVYWKECNNKPKKLLDYLKQNHPDIYEEL